MRYEYYGHVVSVKDADAISEFNVTRESEISAEGFDFEVNFRLPARDAGALYAKMVHVIVEVEQ